MPAKLGELTKDLLIWLVCDFEFDNDAVRNTLKKCDSCATYVQLGPRVQNQPFEKIAIYAVRIQGKVSDRTSLCFASHRCTDHGLGLNDQVVPNGGKKFAVMLDEKPLVGDRHCDQPIFRMYEFEQAFWIEKWGHDTVCSRGRSGCAS